MAVNNGQVTQPMGLDRADDRLITLEASATALCSPVAVAKLKVVRCIHNATHTTITQDGRLLFLNISFAGNSLVLKSLQLSFTISVPCRHKVLSIAQRFSFVFVLLKDDGETQCHRYDMNLANKTVLFTVAEADGRSSNFTMTVSEDRTLTIMYHSGPDPALVTYTLEGVRTSLSSIQGLIVSPGVWALSNGKLLLSRLSQACHLYQYTRASRQLRTFYIGGNLKCVTTDERGVVYGLCVRRSSGPTCMLRIHIIFPQGEVRMLKVPNTADTDGLQLDLANVELRLSVRNGLIVIEWVDKTFHYSAVRLYRTS